MPSLESLREVVYKILNPITDWLVRNRVHPNLLTTVGFFVTVGAGILFSEHRVRMAGLFVLLGFAAILFMVTQITNRGYSLKSDSYRLTAAFENIGGESRGRIGCVRQP